MLLEGLILDQFIHQLLKKNYKSEDVISEYPKSWFKGMDIKKVISSKYDKKVNKYGVKCGSSLEDLCMLK